ncbi:GNAT family N-acetyltransferase [Chthonomonas calidirosea]|uniref:GNAT family N-acetyltransferase n=1 Tax=Chthonomonas calidirosea TaxID=454171 RepID=UPI0006EC77F5|nr:GNAT family N-acetyltransferase [Chthonomonas calidirosea]CEK14539.1 predicted acyltransferase [Chthonomonas calidirosea]
MAREASALQVRPLVAADAEACARLFDTDVNRFLTSRVNLEVYGYQNGALPSWGAFDEGRLEGVLFRYANMVVVVDRDGRTAASFASIVDGQEGLLGARGSLETIYGLRAALRRYRVIGLEVSPFMRLDSPPQCEESLLRLARRATIADLDKLADLYAGAGNMYRSRPNVMSKLSSGRVFVVEEQMGQSSATRIVSCALLNVESQHVGLIGGVYTRPESRGHGYAAACTAALALDLQKDGKLPCLFYENPVAGRLYRRLGFREVSMWGLLYLEDTQEASGRK